MKRGLIKNKSDNSRFEFPFIKINILPNSKRSQEVFGMSFGVIFSIILIVFILVVAGIAVNHFLGLKKCTQIGLFIEDFAEEGGDIDTAWNSQKFIDEIDYALPSNLDYVCFANLSNSIKGGSIESKVYSDISIYKFANGNMFFYPREKACNMPYVTVKHIDINKITESKNPYCIPVEDGKIRIKIEKGFNEEFVRLS